MKFIIFLQYDKKNPNMIKKKTYAGMSLCCIDGRMDGMDGMDGMGWLSRWLRLLRAPNGANKAFKLWRYQADNICKVIMHILRTFTLEQMSSKHQLPSQIDIKIWAWVTPQPQYFKELDSCLPEISSHFRKWNGDQKKDLRNIKEPCLQREEGKTTYVRDFISKINKIKFTAQSKKKKDQKGKTNLCPVFH